MEENKQQHEKTESKSEKQSEIVELAMQRFNDVISATSEMRDEMLDDIKFVRLGEQWDERIVAERNQPGNVRPTLTINRLFQFRQQIINDIRQNKPSIKVVPFDDKSDVKTAEVLADLVRHIQISSNADIAYDIATEWQVDCGLGYFLICNDYLSDTSFDQELMIKPIVNAFAVYFDPSSTEPDGSDARYAFVVQDMSLKEFETSYPNVEVQSFTESGRGDSEWVSFTEDRVRVANYYVIEATDRELALLNDGTTAWEDEVEEGQRDLIIKTRTAKDKVCKIYKIGGNKILEESELKTQYIPVVPVYGNSLWLNNQQYVHGLTRFSKDSARLYNYFQSANAELLALAPKAPYIVAEGQLDGHENQWKTANSQNHAYLTYNPVAANGQIAAAPRREPPPSTSPGLESAMNRSVEDIKATMGLYDASMGNRESNQSGKAILNQQNQAAVGNFHFSDNLNRSIRHAGKILIELIPSIYDTARVLRITGEDDVAKDIEISPDAPEAVNEVKDEESGKTIKSIYNLGIGQYDVTISTGASYASKRQEAVETLLSLAQTDPSLMQSAGDIIIKSMDFPGAEEIAERKRLTLPPEIQQFIKSEGDEIDPNAQAQQQVGPDGQPTVDPNAPPPVDPQIEQQMNQMASQIEEMSTALQAVRIKEDELEIKRFEAQTKRMEVEAKMLENELLTIAKLAEADLKHTLENEPNDGALNKPQEVQTQQPEQPVQQVQPEMQQPEVQQQQPVEPSQPTNEVM